MTFWIETLGCKVNAYESMMMEEKLKEQGWQKNKINADVVIINTCSVTNIADQKSRKTVRRLQKEHPTAILVVCGCSSENHEEDYRKMGISILLGNKEKSQIVSLIKQYQKNQKAYEYFSHTRMLPFEDMEVHKFQHTRAYLKIQDGCDNFCTYCIIPYVRGTRRCKNFQKAIEEAEELVKNGHKEIVLTGIHTGSYYDSSKDLTDLIHEISKIEGLERIRISSIEENEIQEKFLQELKQNPKICNHLHIPIQAGSDPILKRMNRKYTVQEFKEKIEQIRAIRPDICISTDCLVGFPSETEELFETTLQTCKDIGFAKIHVFPYSIRENTVAQTMKEQVDGKTKHERSNRLCALSNELEIAYERKFLKQVVEVLIEEVNEQKSIGHTSNYLKVEIPGVLERNKIYKVILEKEEQGFLRGSLVEEKNKKSS